jgi:aminoglycoside phosphotransferase (APT) family kinase protein
MVQPRVLDWTERFAQQVPSLLSRYSTEPVTICHGDARLDNMFFDGDGGFAMVDWQLSMRSPGGADLVYFLISNLHPEIRRGHERQLIDTYRAALYDAGVPESAYTEEMAWTGYREGALFWCVALATSLVTLDPGNDRGQRLLDTLVTRVYAAADELEAGDILQS